MVHLEKTGKDIDKEKFKNNLIWSERFRRVRKKIFSIPFLKMLGIWIIVYYQFTSHFHHPGNGIEYGDFVWKTVKIVQR